MYCKAAYEDLISYGVVYKTFKWKVPKAVEIGTPKIITEFIKGFADSEGGIDKDTRRISLTSVRKEGLRQVRYMLDKLGIRSTIQIRKAHGSRKESYQLQIQDRNSIEKFVKLIGFTIKRKQKALLECIKSYKLYKTPHKEAEKMRPESIKLRRQSYSFSEISRKPGLSIGTVWKHCQKFNRI